MSTSEKSLTSTTSGLPCVIVPVLSKTIFLALLKISKACEDLMRIEFFAASPVATIIAVGVASPKAQGQEITSTAIAKESAVAKSFELTFQITSVIIDIKIIAGTKNLLTVSAILAIGALDAAASSTKAIIFERVVSPLTFWALISKYPPVSVVPQNTLSPIFFSTGILSPVSADSSVYPSPSITTPSTETLLPLLMITISPTITSSVGISISTPSRLMSVLSGDNSISLDIACVVFTFERDSKYLPTDTKVSIIPADSKYRLCI